MPQLSNIDWLSILSNEDGKYVVMLVGYVVAVYIFGLVEFFIYETTRPGFTTWAFALPGVLAMIVVVALDGGLGVVVRAFLILAWCLIVALAVSFGRAVSHKRHGARAR